MRSDEPPPGTDKLTFWLIVFSTIAFIEIPCGGIFGIPPVSDSPDCGQGIGLFWMLLLVLVSGLTPMMRWSVKLVTQYRPSWSAAYKAAYAGMILCFDIFFVASILWPEIETRPIGSMPAGAIALILVSAIATHSIAAALLRTPESRRVGIAGGTTIAVTYVFCVGLGAAVLWAFTRMDSVQHFLESISA